MSAVTMRNAITRVSIVTIHVKDQDAALRFYTECLGFEKRTDAPMGAGMRWLTVAPAGSVTEFVLVSGYAEDSGAPMGTRTGVVLETDDVDDAYRHLSGHGVQFTELPAKHPWGGWASFVDPDGNGFGLHQEIGQP